MKYAYDVESPEYAWLKLNESDLRGLNNPFDDMNDWQQDNFHLYVLQLMRNPKYLHWTTKILLGVDLLPEQTVILQELWTKSFPMYIASRGFGKLVSPDTPILVKEGWKRIEDIRVGDMVYGSDGLPTKVISKTDKQFDVKMYRVTLRDGRTIDCCEDHQWKVWEKNKNRNNPEPVWSTMKTKDMAKDYYWDRIGSKSNGREYKLALPINKEIQGWSKKKFVIHPYIIGVLLGD